MKKTLALLIGSAFCASILSAQTTLLQFDFDQTAGTRLIDITPTVGGVHANANSDGFAVTDGAGNLDLAGDWGQTDLRALTSSVDSTADSSVYEIAVSGVTFNNLASGDDWFVFAYRTGTSGSALPDSGNTRGWMKFGDFGGTQGQLDVEAGDFDAGDDTTFDVDVNDVDSVATSNTFDFIARWDMGASELSFFYDIGSGRQQVGSTISDTDGTITHLGMYSHVIDAGTNGDTISIDQITVTSVVPEPSSFALLGGLLALGFVVNRRRR